MKKIILLIPLLFILAACSQVPPLPTPPPVATSTPEETVLKATETSSLVPLSPSPTAFQPTLAPTRTPQITPQITPTVKLESNPLTGLPALEQNLNRRPILVKVENLPREDRPQWGLSLADLVYHYYTEEGSTRYAALYYGQDAEMVAPVRSGRYFDSHLVRAYKAIFAFGSAYEKVFTAYLYSDFAKRLVLEGTYSCPAICRFDPEKRNYLMVNTTAMADYLKTRSIDNSRPKLEGMTFQITVPEGGKPLEKVFVRFSGAIYNRWDYDSATGKYLRFSDAANDLQKKNEVYTQLTDRLNGKPISADNVVILLATYVNLEPKAEVYDINLVGSGKAYLLRDGKIYEVKWQRTKADDVLSLVGTDGKPFAFKPGATWFEVLGTYSKVETVEGGWRFTFVP